MGNKPSTQKKQIQRSGTHGSHKSFDLNALTVSEAELVVHQVDGEYPGPFGVMRFAQKSLGASSPKEWSDCKDAFLSCALEGGSAFCICEAHGSAGKSVAKAVAASLLASIKTDNQLAEDPKGAISFAFHSADTKLRSSRIDQTLSGCTATLVVFLGVEVHVGNVGNSACVVFGTHAKKKLSKATGFPEVVPTQITEDHVCSNLQEMERVINSGGRVEPFRGPDCEAMGPPRLWLPTERVPGLTITRCFGNTVAQRIGVQAVPTISSHTLSTNDHYMVLATDGVWDVCSAKSIARDFFSHINPDIVLHTDTLAHECLVRQKTRYLGTSKEVSLAVLCLRPFAQ